MILIDSLIERFVALAFVMAAVACGLTAFYQYSRRGNSPASVSAAVRPRGPRVASQPLGHVETSTIRLTPPAPDSPIVGRAICGTVRPTMWALNRASQLIGIQPAIGRASVYAAGAFLPDARPRGLACRSDGRGLSLWTLETLYTIAQMGSDGRVIDRTPLRWPRTALFTAGERAVFHQLPTVPGAPLLASSPPERPFDVRPWSGLTGRPLSPDPDPFAHNTVNCGVPADRLLPCWFVNEARVVVSDGTAVREIPEDLLTGAMLDHVLPVRDAAAVPSGAVWVLASARPALRAQRLGGRLLEIDERGRERVRIDLAPPARMIVSASRTICTLLTARGELLEVRTTAN